MFLSRLPGPDAHGHQAARPFAHPHRDRLAGHEIGRVRAFVSEGEMDVSLLGMDFLRRFGRISIEGRRMVLEF